ncbi:hypothetical protein BDW59DRAFT_124077 [Aspergillus cavernicola]|uniref:Zn(2)-C6 fungal-type domain-containing protein n=1 Tax=Aspergillus cavernicola TaxID=176166 RepID=A0ABR4IVD3_9EURO
MYMPVRPRPKKTNIIRSRSGCKSCRERRTKCDEQKPSCGTCTRLRKPCESVCPELRFHVVTGPSPSYIASEGPKAGSSVTGEERNGVGHDGLWIPDLDLVKSLQHTERDVFYTTYWEDVCLPAVHPMFAPISLSAWDKPMLKDTILALSSCNLSRIRPDRKGSSSSHIGIFSPNLIHQTRSQLYYSSAIEKFVALKRADVQSNATTIFIVLVLFAYIESSMGNFQGFQCHVQGLANFAIELPEVIGDTTIKALLTAWMQVRFVVWWARAYFSTIYIHRGLPPVHLPRLLDGCFESIQARRVLVLSIMCESHRLNSRNMLGHWCQAEGRDLTVEAHHESTSDASETIYLQLGEQAKKLGEWLLHLPSSEQPVPLGQSEVLHSACNLQYSDVPIRFISHDAALNFSYYVVARIMQCTSSLRQFQHPNSDQYEPSCSEEETWIRVLLRIAKATSMKDSISKNTYTIGFSGLMLPAILRCQNVSLGIEIQNWLESLERLQPTEEGAFPVYQTLGVVKAINQQRMIGREIFGVTLSTDDAGGTPKFTAYNSQSISSLLLHGRCPVSGKFLTESVSIDL